MLSLPSYLFQTICFVSAIPLRQFSDRYSLTSMNFKNTDRFIGAVQLRQVPDGKSCIQIHLLNMGMIVLASVFRKHIMHERCKKSPCSNLYSDRAVILRITEVRHSQRRPSPGEDQGGRVIGEPGSPFRHRTEQNRPVTELCTELSHGQSLEVETFIARSTFRPLKAHKHDPDAFQAPLAPSSERGMFQLWLILLLTFFTW